MTDAMLFSTFFIFSLFPSELLMFGGKTQYIIFPFSLMSPCSMICPWKVGEDISGILGHSSLHGDIEPSLGLLD